MVTSTASVQDSSESTHTPDQSGNFLIESHVRPCAVWDTVLLSGEDAVAATASAAAGSASASAAPANSILHTTLTIRSLYRCESQAAVGISMATLVHSTERCQHVSARQPRACQDRSLSH